MYTFYEYPKCTTCKKAKKELQDLGLEFEAIDIKTNPPKVEILREWMGRSDLNLKQFFNTSGDSYRELGLKDKFDSLTVDEALELLSQDGMLIKRPILLKDQQVLQIGYRTSYADLQLES
ncbi:Spx/MgsR family RNA polymerase-binding regulatory protein [Streptococcus sp. X16XC17]|uniref:Spx/MgsR family RNA polymerase-binding regulatory protein n=1 Tax=unclassified Streptococcus TaxID=2608887 RepID=UPI00066FDD07|nr:MULTISPECIES: Spx/MgsR family RNA polymerase-binding regulatory protein [unclassified Streptococcus]TCD46628.1 Spx/MgsR family RNA polymerase-binding regulatory protein [Streptococcus sp. X16XC17]